MDYKKMYLEEDLFPREITCFIEKDYGILFYNDDNKDSFDSNHAIIYRNKISVHIPQELRIRSRGTERHSASD